MKKRIDLKLHILILILIFAVCISSGCGKKEEKKTSEASETTEEGAEVTDLSSLGSEENAETEIESEMSDEIPSDEPETEGTEELSEEVNAAPDNEPGEMAYSEENVDRIISEMSLDQKVYQLFVVTPEQLTGIDKVTAAGNATYDALKKRPVGGIIYFASNLVDPLQTKSMLSVTQEIAEDVEGFPLFLAVDEEGGRVTRIAGNPAFNKKNVGPMSEVKSADEAYACGDHIGHYLSEYGFNLDFAPDTDVRTNSENKVIGDRSFSSDPSVVSQYGKAYSDGLHANGILSTFKHFPGHGDTLADSHKGYAYSDKTYEELKNCELMPFMAAEEYGVDVIMAAHVSLPNVLKEDTPCSLSKKMITDVLRNELGYNGIVITDALYMGAITESYGSAEAAKKAFMAGCDLMLMPSDLTAAHDAIFTAVKSGEISEERVDESLRRIVGAKLRQEDGQRKKLAEAREKGIDSEIDLMFEGYGDEPWKEAYREIITDFIKEIKEYDYPEYEDMTGFELIYIDDNDIPELFMQNIPCGGGDVYTFKNGRAENLELPTGWWHGCVYYRPRSGLYLENSWDGAGSVQYYQVFKVDDGKVREATPLLRSECDGDYKYTADDNEISEKEFHDYFKPYGEEDYDHDNPGIASFEGFVEI